jgi:hypothetical protein
MAAAGGRAASETDVGMVVAGLAEPAAFATVGVRPQAYLFANGT